MKKKHLHLKTKLIYQQKMMQYQTTAGWSLITSGLTTLLLKVLPGNSLWWGIAFLAIGGVILYVRKNDVAKT